MPQIQENNTRIQVKYDWLGNDTDNKGWHSKIYKDDLTYSDNFSETIDKRK